MRVRQSIKAQIKVMEMNQDRVPLVGGAAYSVVKNLLSSEKEKAESNNPSHAKPSLSPSLSLSPIPTPSGSAGEVSTARSTAKPMGKNRGVNGQTVELTKEQREFVEAMERRKGPLRLVRG
jgi:hypothetical protein